MSENPPQTPTISVADLLKKLHKPEVYGRASAEDIAVSFALIFEENRLSSIQTATFLTLLTTTLRDRDADVIAACAAQMRLAALPVNTARLQAVMKLRHEGTYHGGLCDIVGTGGSIHQTYNISTTASLIASSLLLMSKHGNKAQTSVSGAADILSSITPIPPSLTASTPGNIPQIYERSTYAFLFAPNFHPGMRLAATVRREMGIRTIFNLLGPLAHPVEELVEARVVGVADGTLGPVFAEALQISSADKPLEKRKAMVVAGCEGLDEISCAGPTDCWLLQETGIEHFQLHPSDFGFPVHPLSAVRGGNAPKDNSEILMRLLEGKLEKDDPILQVVLMNAAAMFVVSGICESETSDMVERDDGAVLTERGPGKGRWKEGVRRARWAIESGAALKSLKAFTNVSNKLGAS